MIAALLGAVLAIPVLLLAAQIPATPITPIGAGYLAGCALLVAGLLTAPWRTRRARGLTRIALVCPGASDAA
jgi:hypothetical protein